MRIVSIEFEIPRRRGGKGNDNLLATCSVSLEGDIGQLVIHSVKVIRKDGRYIVAMPSTRITVRCDKCDGARPVDSNFCCWCGRAVEKQPGEAPRAWHGDIVHPLDQPTRMKFEAVVLEHYFDFVNKQATVPQ